MELETARWLVVGITAVGAVVWLTSLTMLLRASNEERGSASRDATQFAIVEDPAAGTIVGATEVEGQPEALSAKLASQLARDGNLPFGPVKIVARDRNEVAFEPAGTSDLGLISGRFRLHPSGAKTRIEYAVTLSRRPFLLIGWIMLAIGLAALIAAPTAALLFAVSSPNPSVRVQAIQTVQMVHFLWPPILLAFLARQRGRAVSAKMESLVHNLPFT